MMLMQLQMTYTNFNAIKRRKTGSCQHTIINNKNELGNTSLFINFVEIGIIKKWSLSNGFKITTLEVTGIQVLCTIWAFMRNLDTRNPPKGTQNVSKSKIKDAFLKTFLPIISTITIFKCMVSSQEC
jgi:hypothetical protein